MTDALHPYHLAPFAIAVLLAMPPVTHAQDARNEWPKGSAPHTLYVQGERLQADRTSLDQAHASLLEALDNDPTASSSLARSVASQQAQWLAYRHADCELAGTLTGAGGAWPSVHGLNCEIESIAERLEVVRSATACLHQSGPDAPRYEQLECLQGLVAWSMEED